MSSPSSRCPPPERLAAAVTEPDPDLLAHLETCASCQGALDGQRGIHVLVGNLRAPAPLDRVRRESLTAEVLARADLEIAPVAARAGRRRWAAFAGALAVAASVVMVLQRSGTEPRPAEPTRVAEQRATPRPAPEPARAPTAVPQPQPQPPLVRPRTRVVAPGARMEASGAYTRALREGRDVVVVTSGELVLDSKGTPPVDVLNGDTRVVVANARARVIAKRGVISSVAVFAGSVEVTIAGERRVIEAGKTWDRDADREASLTAFRTGWEALRAEHYPEAVAAFDLATDDVVGEDALYWGAIASERAGDPEGALRRYRALTRRFPASPRLEATTAAITRLAP